MQTGNTVFAALGVSDLPISQPRLSWTKSLCSILSFLLGSAAFSTFHRLMGGRKRWVLMLSFTIQTAFIALSALLVQNGKSSDSPAKKPPSLDPSFVNITEDPGFPWTDLIPIGLLSCQAAGKVVASRVLEFSVLPTVVLTTLFNDLMSDPYLLTAGIFSNVQRNRRVGGLAFYFGGAVLGGVMAKSSLGLAGALWIAVALKGAIILVWLVWKEDTSDDTEG
ncbi:hypothetical protein LTS18_004712 [Coniosporium uncinatum]|uniref:Uncharacterized protein n=1 Tax=Coniosporium uncinatum TaxID=93489 RepID=A0ACC3D5R9_9PEZI|nr:hypothetical protein LTS18_004712 [Coniosporium uncinatum]